LGAKGWNLRLAMVYGSKETVVLLWKVGGSNRETDCKGRVPDKDMLGSTPDLSQYAQLDLYEPVLYLGTGGQLLA
jgi:hypothetical protein